MRYSIATLALLGSGFAVAAPFDTNAGQAIEARGGKNDVPSYNKGHPNGLVPSVLEAVGLGPKGSKPNGFPGSLPYGKTPEKDPYGKAPENDPYGKAPEEDPYGKAPEKSPYGKAPDVDTKYGDNSKNNDNVKDYGSPKDPQDYGEKGYHSQEPEGQYSSSNGPLPKDQYKPKPSKDYQGNDPQDSNVGGYHGQVPKGSYGDTPAKAPKDYESENESDGEGKKGKGGL